MDKIPGKIQKLDEIVINRIAAGEVIQRPANALKELIENSLDAGASNVSITVKSGGLKLLQIQDDGTGIREEDLPIVCERFTTSKLRTFEDLQNIGTFGFRGEALASMSHVAHLTILTKTVGDQSAFRAEYVDGKLKVEEGQQNPRRCAGKQGTTIIIEDLFYNMDTRRKALKNPSEEHAKILDVVTKYAVHNHMVGFSFKKHGETITDIRTPVGSTVLENVKMLYGAQIARELLPVSCEDGITKFTMRGYVSNVNYSTKKLNFILFINNRLVESQGLRKTIESIYTNYLPKGMHPFLYIAIDVDPRNLDVNVHPTKHEVHFLHEDSIISSISSAIENVLLGSNESRNFLVQSLLPGASVPATTVPSGNRKRKDGEPHDQSSRIDPKNIVRTDPKMQKLDKFLCSTPDPNLSRLKSFQDSPSNLEPTFTNKCVESFSEPIMKVGEPVDGSQASLLGSSMASSVAGRKREIRLRSVKNMKDIVVEKCNELLQDMFKNHTFVGCVDRTLSLFQHETMLYICNVNKLSKELFYQKLIYDFGNFGRITIEDPIQLKELVGLAIEMEPMEETEMNLGNESGKEEMIDTMCNLLMNKRKMLDDYFSLSFDSDGRVISLPLLLNNYFPQMEGLAMYIKDLAAKVDWTEEQRCFETFCDVTAEFYAIPPGDGEKLKEFALNGKTWKWNIEHIIFPQLQRNFLPPRILGEDSTILQLTSLPELYKVFERC